MSTKTDRYHQDFADRIIAAIREGTTPWQKPWKPGERFLPSNVKTGRAYTGGNTIQLVASAEAKGFAAPRWGTYRQIKSMGGQVRKGESGTPLLFFQNTRRVMAKDSAGRPILDANGKKTWRHIPLKAPYFRLFTVFNVEQADGLPPLAAGEAVPLWKVHEAAERVIADNDDVTVRHVEGDRAYYHLRTDRITLPKREQFETATLYYQTALHELAHSTGHPDRLDRETLTEGIKAGFGSPLYAREELRAEIAAMMIGERVGVGHNPDRGAAYIEGWIAALEDDPQEIRRAAADAQKIADFVLAAHDERQAEDEMPAAA